jgi:hypothetical protein
MSDKEIGQPVASQPKAPEEVDETARVFIEKNYAPKVFGPLFMNAVESLKSKKAHPVEILEVLCKDFLATIIDSQSTEIQLSSLKINTF